MGTSGKQGKTRSASDPLREAMRLSKKYSTNYVDVLEPSNSGRSPVVRRMHVEELREPLATRFRRTGHGRRGSPATVTSVIDSFEALQSGKVAQRLREIRASLREDSDGDMSIKSLVTLRQALGRVPRVPDPRIGSGESGILEAVWSFGDEGMLVLDCREDGRLGCVILPRFDGGAFSETLDVGSGLHSAGPPLPVPAFWAATDWAALFLGPFRRLNHVLRFLSRTFSTHGSLRDA